MPPFRLFQLGLFPLLLSMLLFSVGCGSTTLTVIAPLDPSRYRNFQVEDALLPFWAEGAVKFSFRGKKESGSMILQAAGGPSYRILLKAPITGAVVLEMRIGTQGLLVLDFINATYYAGINSEANRRHLFQLDLTPEEFQIALTGRVRRSVFLAGGGRFEGRQAFFRQGATEHRFDLDAHGLPLVWERKRPDAPTLRVEYRQYQELGPEAGGPMRVPRKVRITQTQSKAQLVLGIRRFVPGASGGALPGVGALPLGAREFTRTPLPDPGGR